MLIVGAKGFAKEVLEVILNCGDTGKIKFYDDVNIDNNVLLFDKFEVINNLSDVQKYFEEIDDRFTLGVGNPQLRRSFAKKFASLGGKLTSTVSPKANIGTFDVDLSNGINILSGVQVSNQCKIGKGVLIYYNSVITHDCVIGDFVEISPSVNILGRCKIGNDVKIGSNSTILPDISIGENSIIGAGSVVTKSVHANSLVYGNPAKLIKLF